MPHTKEFDPDWVSPPGDTIHRLMSSRGLDNQDLATKLGKKAQLVAGLVSGAHSLTDELAEDLAKIFGASASFWLRRERQFVDQLSKSVLSLGEKLPDWLDEVPFKSMVENSWISEIGRSKREKIVALFRFLGVSNLPLASRKLEGMLGTVAYKHTSSFESSSLALSIWLRQAEIISRTTRCSPWDKKSFLSALDEILPLTRVKSPELFLPKLRDICSRCGVAVVFVKSPVKCRATAATKFITSEKAMIALSGRYLSDDHFWFAFFHEAGHLVLHDQNKLFVEESTLDESAIEHEANEFAVSRLISKTELYAFSRGNVSVESIIKFARKVGVSPGIVVGQLQYTGRLKPSYLNSLKRRYTWESLLA